MKKGFFLCLSFYCILTHGQINMGTLEVNSDNTATLKFASDIQNVVFGNNPQVGSTQDGRPRFKFYDNFSSGKTDVIRLNEVSAPGTSITIILDNEEVYFGILTTGSHPQIFYDFSTIKKTELADKQMKDSLEKKVVITRLQERLKFVMARENGYSDIGVVENKMVVQVASIMNDDKNTYLKFVIRNNSGSDYRIDNVIFKYVEGKNKGLKNKEAQIEERISPMVEPAQKTIKACSNAELGYVIPLFTVSESGVFMIQMIEANGTRNPKIQIDAKTMLKVKKLKMD